MTESPTTATTAAGARPPLTPCQRRVLAAVVRLTGEVGHPPSFRELTADLGFASPNAVAVPVKALVAKGYLETALHYRGGLGRTVARCAVVPELKAALRGAADEYLDALGGSGVAKNRPDATYKLGIDGHTLTGERWGGRWQWRCPSWPDLAEKYAGVEDSGPAVEEFTRRALGAAEDRAGA